MVPMVVHDHDINIDAFLPQLSEKNEITIYPIKAPKYVALLTKSSVASSSQ